MNPFRTSLNRLPEPHRDFSGTGNTDAKGKRAFAFIAKLWQPRGVTNEPAAATVSRFSLRLIDRETGRAYSFDELREILLSSLGGAVGGGENDGFSTAINEDDGLDLTLWDQGTGTFRRVRLENGALIVVA